MRILNHALIHVYHEQAINEDNLHARNFVDVCFTALLEQWLTQTPTWTDLIDALSSPIIERDDIASNIKALFES